MSETEEVQIRLGLEEWDESPWEWGVYVERNHAEDAWTSVIYAEGNSLKDAQHLLRSFWDSNSKSYRNPCLVRRPVGPWEVANDE